MTARLYYTDAACLAFTARVAELADDGRRVHLDRTAFYPTSGGQPHDLGTLGGVPVIDVIDEGDRVAHLLGAPLAARVGDEVHGAIDAARRLDHMQQHTGQHLLSAVFADLFGHETLSVHFGADVSTLDLAAERVAPERLREAEARANALVAENRAVTVTFEDAATATGLRKPSERAGTLRVVTIDGVDRSACGGTHVSATGAIGVVLLRRTERVRQATRVEFVCGLRAARRARADYEALSGMAARFSTSVDDVAALVAAQGEQARAASARAETLVRALAAQRVAGLPAGRVLVRAGDPLLEQLGEGADGVRALAQAAQARPGLVLVALSPVAAAEGAWAVAVGAAPDTGVQAGSELRAALAAVGGRGGGAPGFAQGTAPDRARAEQVAAAFV